jgi:D-arabinose 1-dehydrogenase-like Zn-dependent alcohol dehydrogenase
LIVLGAAGEPAGINLTQLIFRRQGIQGWPSGTSIDSEDTMAFSALTGVRPMVETFPLERAGEAFERMMSNQARFRVVLTTARA